MQTGRTAQAEFGILKLSRIVSVLAGLICLVAHPSLAQETASPDGDLDRRIAQRLADASYLSLHGFELADSDGDGRLDQTEYAAGEWMPYARFDLDGDGGLNMAEYEDQNCGGFGPQPAGQFDIQSWCLNYFRREFRHLARGRPLITPASIASRSRDRFRFIDLNRDHFVTRDEEVRAFGVVTGR